MAQTQGQAPAKQSPQKEGEKKKQEEEEREQPDLHTVTWTPGTSFGSDSEARDQHHGHY